MPLAFLASSPRLRTQYSRIRCKPRSHVTASTSYDCDVAVVGAGIAGLSAAKVLAQAGRNVQVFEAGDDVGGRMRSDETEGFILDRGFQVFVEGYPMAQKMLNYEDLELQRFVPGALVRAEDNFHTVVDPFRNLVDSLGGIFSPVGSLVDKVKVALLRNDVMKKTLDEIFSETEKTTKQYLLEDAGFSQEMIDRFFRPFYQGIFLTSLDQQSSTMFQFLFKMFASAPASLPRKGIATVPSQIASSIKDLATINLNTPVLEIQPNKLILSREKSISALSVIVATDGYTAAELLKPKLPKPVSRGSICLYFTSPNAPPVSKPILILNGESEGLVNNMFFPSTLSPSYAPRGETLISTTIVDDGASPLTTEEREAAVRDQMKKWFGVNEVSQWKFLREYKIPYSQPGQIPPNESFEKNPEITPGLFVCGDHRNTPTVNGAISSGIRTAEAALKNLHQSQQHAATIS